MSDTIDGYAEALLAVVRAEGATGADDEIFRFAQALEGNDELRNTLSDPYVPAEKRQQIVEDLLQGKASNVARAAVSLVVGAGRAAELPAIARALVAKGASASGKEIAEVRSARLLDGFRGAPLGDKDAVAATILRVSALIESSPEIVEMDMNPVLVGTPGQGVEVVDARVRVRKPASIWMPSRKDIPGAMRIPGS